MCVYVLRLLSPLLRSLTSDFLTYKFSFVSAHLSSCSFSSPSCTILFAPPVFSLGLEPPLFVSPLEMTMQIHVCGMYEFGNTVLSRKDYNVFIIRKMFYEAMCIKDLQKSMPMK